MILWTLLTLALCQLETVIDLPTNPNLPKRFIVHLNVSISDSEWRRHNELINSVVNGSMGYNLNTIATRLNIPTSIRQRIPNVGEDVVKLTLENSRGLLGQFNITTFKGYHGQFPDWLVEIMKEIPQIQMVEDDIRVTIQQQPTSKGYLSQQEPTLIQVNPPWGLDRISHRDKGFQGRYVYPANGGEGVDVYVVDTGVRIDHDELRGRAFFGASFSDDGPEDRQGHGTHCAGIIAGNLFGVAKKTNIISVKVLNNNGAGSASRVVSGIEWIIKNARVRGRRAVVNMSLGGDQPSEALNRMVAAAVAQDIAFAVAAGNYNQDACISSPQNSGLVMTVGATDQEDRVASFSNFGRCVNIFAPGTNITSASFVNADSTRTISGTSQAAPHVAGQMAILLSRFPTVKVNELYKILQDTATRKVITGLRPNDPDLLLFNGVPIKETQETIVGTDFGYGGGGWTLVREVLLSVFL
jgi:cerevisin